MSVYVFPVVRITIIGQPPRRVDVSTARLHSYQNAGHPSVVGGCSLDPHVAGAPVEAQGPIVWQRRRQ